jgi:hypothetical protein
MAAPARRWRPRPAALAAAAAPRWRRRLPATIAAVSKRERAVSGLKAVPWTLLLQVGLVLDRRWRRLSEKERARLLRLLRESRGRLDRLSAKQREDLRKLVRKLDLMGAGRELRPLIRSGRRRKR